VILALRPHDLLFFSSTEVRRGAGVWYLLDIPPTSTYY
jgi:hypothetical protein